MNQLLSHKKDRPIARPVLFWFALLSPYAAQTIFRKVWQ